MNDQYCVYIMSNPNRTVLYIGMTSDIAARILSHKQKLVEGFTKDYNCVDCVYFEFCGSRDQALFREKQLKGWRRQKKEDLIGRFNPSLNDLSDKFLDAQAGLR